MPISAECPTCNRRVRLPDNAVGKRFRCPRCQGVILGPRAKPPAPTIQPKNNLDPGFVDAPDKPDERSPFDEPIPISQAARQAAAEGFNPFDDGSTTDGDDTAPKKRYYQPKDDYNPFTDPSAFAPAAPDANPEVLFDFGIEEVPPANSPSDDLDFGSSGGDTPGRRR